MKPEWFFILISKRNLGPQKRQNFINKITIMKIQAVSDLLPCDIQNKIFYITCFGIYPGKRLWKWFIFFFLTDFAFKKGEVNASLQKPVIYIDVLVLLNLFVNYLLLLSVNKILRQHGKGGRIFLSALLGGGYSLIILFPQLSPFMLFVQKLFLSFVMVGIAFRFTPLKKIIYKWLLFVGISFLYGGITFALWYFISPIGMIYQNGVAYYPISALSLALFTIAAYFIFWFLENIWQKRVPQKQQIDLAIACNGKEVYLHGLIDTGHKTSDLMTGLPVVICEKEAVFELIPQKLIPFFDSLEPTEDPLWQSRLRVIPLHSVVGKGALPAFRPDRFTLFFEDGTKAEKTVLIAVTDQPIGNGEVEAILSDTLLSQF